MRTMKRAQRIAFGRVRHLEIELGVNEVGHVLAEVARDSAGAGDRPGAGIGDGVGLGEDSDVPQPVQENPVAKQQLFHVGVDPGKAVEDRLDSAQHAVVEVVEHAADAGVTGVKAVSRHLFIDVVDQLAQVERVQESREGPEIERGGAGAEQVIADPGQLGR